MPSKSACADVRAAREIAKFDFGPDKKVAQDWERLGFEMQKHALQLASIGELALLLMRWSKAEVIRRVSDPEAKEELEMLLNQFAWGHKELAALRDIFAAGEMRLLIALTTINEQHVN